MNFQVMLEMSVKKHRSAIQSVGRLGGWTGLLKYVNSILSLTIVCVRVCVFVCVTKHLMFNFPSYLNREMFAAH